MDTVITFRPRPRPAAIAAPVPLTGAALRAQIEAGAQAALDLADQLIGLLDHADGDADLEDTGDGEPSLAAPENHTGSQVTWLRGNDQDREAEAPEADLPKVANEEPPEPLVLPWGGRGNCVAACGVALADLVRW